jgi:ABC-2 type transport system permease protein
MILRHSYLLRSSWPRLFELVYWPAVQMFMWGFLQMGIAKYPGALAGTVSTFLAAFLLWDILFRGQIGYSMSFLEEMWSRNMPNLMISPLRATEFVMALIVMSIVRLSIGLVPVTILAIFFSVSICGRLDLRSRLSSPIFCSRAGRSACSARDSCCGTDSARRVWRGA